MNKDQLDPIENQKEIAFWGDPRLLTQYGNVVTIRKAKDGYDKYDRLEPGDEFDYIVGFNGRTANLGKGKVVAHWELPFKDIPTEIICGEDFPEEYLSPVFRVRETMRDELKNIYGEFNVDTLSHVFVFVYPDEIYENIMDNFNFRNFHQNHDLFFKEFLLEEYIQRDGETPEEWMARECENSYDSNNLADLFFGLNDSYRALKAFEQ